MNMESDSINSQDRHSGGFSYTRRQFFAPLAGLSGLALLSGGCINIGNNAITGSGRLVTTNYDLADFNRVSAAHAFHVTILPGNEYSVSVTVDDNLLEYLNVGKSGSELRLHLKPNTSIRNATMKAQITMPELAGLNLSGATHASISGFSSKRPLDVDISGASKLSGDMAAPEARFDLSGASRLNLQGSIDHLKVGVSGASSANFERCVSRNARVEASGASHVVVNVAESVDASASGASSVRYAGKPDTVRTHTSGASSVKPQ